MMLLRRAIIVGFPMAAFLTGTATAADYLTRNADGNRTGANNAETVISPASLTNGLGGKAFQKIAEYNVDDMIEAQPLVKAGVAVPGKGVHDIVYVATMNNSVYAFDAYTGQTLWLRVEMDPSVWTVNPGNGLSDMDIHGINKRWGISSTPVVDPATNTLFVVTWAKRNNNDADREFRIRGLDLATGNDKIMVNGNAFVPIQGNAFNGNVAFRTGAPPPNFVAADRAWEWYQKLRAGLALADAGAGRTALVAAFSMNGENLGDTRSGHGFVFLYETRGLLGQGGISQNPAIWTTSPDGELAGIWMAGGAPAVDGDAIYFATGNGSLGVHNGQQNYGESFVRLHYTAAVAGVNNGQPSLGVNGFWTVFNDYTRTVNAAGRDQDLGSGGVLAIPGALSLIGIGKDGVLYNVDRSRLTPAFDGMRHLQFGKTDGAGQSEGANTWDALVGNQAPIVATYFAPGGCKAPNNNGVERQYGDRSIGLDCNLTAYNGNRKYTHHHATPVYWERVGAGPILYVWGENATVKAYDYDKASSRVTGFRANGIDVASAGLPPPGGMPGGFMTLSSNAGDKSTGVLFATFPPNGDANMQIADGRLVAYDAGTVVTVKGQKQLKRLRINRLGNCNCYNYGKFSKFTPPTVANGMVYVPTYNQHADVNGPADSGSIGSVVLYGFK
jgi:PQQ enzyme repeat